MRVSEKFDREMCQMIGMNHEKHIIVNYKLVQSLFLKVAAIFPSSFRGNSRRTKENQQARMSGNHKPSFHIKPGGFLVVVIRRAWQKRNAPKGGQ